MRFAFLLLLLISITVPCPFFFFHSKVARKFDPLQLFFSFFSFLFFSFRFCSISCFSAFFLSLLHVTHSSKSYLRRSLFLFFSFLFGAPIPKYILCFVLRTYRCLPCFECDLDDRSSRSFLTAGPGNGEEQSRRRCPVHCRVTYLLCPGGASIRTAKLLAGPRVPHTSADVMLRCICLQKRPSIRGVAE